MTKTDDDNRRAWLYCDACPEGQIFKAGEIDEALEEGWVDTPDKIGQEDEGGGGGAAEPIAELGGGYYQVTHGEQTEKVRGREAAEAKLAEFQSSQE